MTHTGGRPPVGPKTTVRLEPELKAAVEAYGAKHQLGLAEAVRQLVRIGLDEQP